MNCPTCGQPLPNPTRVHHLTDREKDILSAWWLLHSTRAVARFFDLSEQTVKNHLQSARRRNGVHSSAALAALFMAQLRTMDELVANVTEHRRTAA